MYHVTCPSCHAVISTPFVRVGAVFSCGTCHHRYLIDAAHIRHVATSAKSGKSAEAAQGATAPVPGGIHDLSELMKREAEIERDSQFDDYETIAPEPDAPMPPAIVPSEVTPVPIPGHDEPEACEPESTDQRTAQAKPSKAIQIGFAIALTAAVVLACFGGGIWYYLQQNTHVVTPIKPPEQVDTGPVYDGPIFQGLPLLQSTVLEHSTWEQPNSPFISSVQQFDDVYITGQGLEPGDTGEIEFVCKVVSSRPGVILDGDLTISLINPQGIEKAHTTMPIALLSPEHPFPIRIPIPANLDPTTLHPAWSIRIHRWAESAEFSDNYSIETQSAGADTMAEVFVGNETDHEIQAVFMLVSALGEDDQVLRRWRVVWDLPLKPNDYIEIYTRTAVNPSWDIREWTVIAAVE